MHFKTFKISNLISAEIGTESEFEVEESATDLGVDDPVITAPLEFAVTFLKSADRIEATFTNLRTTVSINCSRCLEPITTPISLPYFVYSYLLPNFEHNPVDLADNYVVDLKNNMIDVSEALRNEIVLAMEGFPVCREDCKGICAHCGKNKNRQNCDCVSAPVTEVHKPFADLKTLVQHVSKKKNVR